MCTHTTDNNKIVFTHADTGCVFDGNRGIYMGEAIQELAIGCGWNGEVVGADDEWYDEATEEALSYLNTLCEEGISFGYGYGGSDFMLMTNEWWEGYD